MTNTVSPAVVGLQFLTKSNLQNRFRWSKMAVFVVFQLTALPSMAEFVPVDLGNLGGTGFIQVKAIGADGQVAGGDSALGGSYHAFLWTAEDGMVDLGTVYGYESSATHISDDGRVIGYEVFTPPPEFGRSYAFRMFSWTAGGGMVSHEPIYGIENHALDVNITTGQVIGSSCKLADYDDCRAYSWTPVGGMVHMNPTTECFPYDVNGSGQVVGYCGTQAFIWTENTGMTFLQPLSPSDECYAQAINDLGQIVGNCRESAILRFAFSWTESEGMIKIELPGSSDSFATAVNNSGQVAGNSMTLGRAWSWTKTGGVVGISLGNGVATWMLGLTENGQVVGYATEVLPQTGVQYAFVWTAQDGLMPLILDGGGNSYPRSWNSLGQVVGLAFDSNAAPRGFSWTTVGGILTLEPPGGDSVNGSSDAIAVNHQGQIAGEGYTPDSRYVGVLWNPVASWLFRDGFE